MEKGGRPLSLGLAGMRGEVGAGLTPDLALDFAAAYGSWCDGGKVLIGFDHRASAEMLSDAVISGLSCCGCQVVDGGAMHAGMMQFLVRELGFAGGLYLSGGHQRAGWNSIIPIDRDGSYFNDINQRELFDLYHGKRFRYVPSGALGRIVRLSGKKRDLYWDFLSASLDVAAIRRAKLTVAADFCNGAGALAAGKFRDILGIRLVAVNDKLSPLLPHSPEPGSRCGSPLGSLMKVLKADAGVIFNSDCSRMSLCEDGADRLLSEEYTFPVALDYLLGGSEKNRTVVTNICSSRMIDRVSARHGAKLEKVPVGQSSILDHMKSLGADLGGEGSGSFALADSVRGFDGLLMAGKIIESVAAGNRLSRTVGSMGRLYMKKLVVPCRKELAYVRARKMAGMFDGARVTDFDGWRFDWPDGFLSVRLSGTEAVVRIISESERESFASGRAERARRFFEENGEL